MRISLLQGFEGRHDAAFWVLQGQREGFEADDSPKYCTRTTGRIAAPERV